jgi:hypothetical protein
LTRPFLELSLALTGGAEVDAEFKTQQLDRRILFRGMARSAKMVVSQALFQIDCTSNVDAAGAKTQEIDKRDAPR